MDDMFKKILEDISSDAEKKIHMAEMQNAADALHGLYENFVDAGFTKAQAMDLIKSILLAALGTAMKK